MARSISTSEIKDFPRYNYATLRNQRSIRLLHIQPGQPTEPIRCLINTISLDSSAQYNALSYAWGKAAYDKVIFIEETNTTVHPDSDGQPQVEEQNSLSQLRITGSLHEALSHIRRQDHVLTLWVDAICINQADLNERSAQVQLMSQIYQKASCVRVWLGLEDENSRIAFDWAVSCHANARQIWSEDTGLSPNQFEPTEHRWSRFPAELFCEKRMNKVAATFCVFSSMRTWWSRRWVFQELAFARSAIFICGNQCIDWKVLDTLGSISVALDRVEESVSNLKIATKDYVSTQVMRQIAFRRILDFGELRANVLTLSRQGTVDVLRMLSGMDLCVTDPRDNLYAILSLCDPKTHHIVPDYEKNLIQVYTDGTRAIISEEQSLRSICESRLIDTRDEKVLQALSNEMDVPSWIVDIGDLRHYDKSRSQCFCADGDSESFCLFKNCCEASVLEVTGLYCDEIEIVGWSSCGDDEGGQLASDKLLEQMEDLWDDDPDALLRIVFWDCNDDLTARFSDESFAARKELFYSHVSQLMEGPMFSERVAAISGPEEERKHHFAFDILAFYYAKNLDEEKAWRFCLFTSGRLGWVPETARPGDFVHILLGSPMPLVTRTVDVADEPRSRRCKWHVRIVGQAYVQDIMDGEFVQDSDIGDIEKICLH